MATYTSSQSGNWVDNSTWGGGGHPVSGDTATIRSVDTVTVTSSAVVGNSGVTGTDCLTITGITAQLYSAALAVYKATAGGTITSTYDTPYIYVGGQWQTVIGAYRYNGSSWANTAQEYISGTWQ